MVHDVTEPDDSTDGKGITRYTMTSWAVICGKCRRKLPELGEYNASGKVTKVTDDGKASEVNIMS